MTAYYNEFDGYPAQWLWNLSTEGLIAQGTVDERSIIDVNPGDLEGFSQCHFFAGIGGWSYALRLAGVPDGFPIWTGSCPCQPFSVAGKQRGFDDTRHLWPEWFRLIKERRPPIIFGEQVGGPPGLKWLDAVFADLEGIGYSCGATNIPAASVGAPHIRQRLYFVAYGGGARLEIKRLEQTWREQQASERGCSTDVVGIPAGTRLGYTEDTGADSEDARRGPETRERGPSGRAESERNGSVGGMVYGDEAGRPIIGGQELQDTGTTLRDHADGRGADDLLGNTGSEGSRRISGSVPSSEEEGSRERGSSGGVVDLPFPAGSDDPRDVADSVYPGRTEGRPESRHGSTSWGCSNSPWRDVVWLPCTDNKARPVKPGLECLVDGVPGRLADGRAVEGSRTGMLKGFGNAIVPPLAAVFIRSSLEAIA